MNFLRWEIAVLVISRHCLKSERNFAPFGELAVPAPVGGVAAARPKSVPSLGVGRTSLFPRSSCGTLGARGAEQADPPSPSLRHRGVPPGSLQQNSSASQRRAWFGGIRSKCPHPKPGFQGGGCCRAGLPWSLGQGSELSSPWAGDGGWQQGQCPSVSLSFPAAPSSQNEVTLSDIAQV